MSTNKCGRTRNEPSSVAKTSCSTEQDVFTCLSWLGASGQRLAPRRWRRELRGLLILMSSLREAGFEHQATFDAAREVTSSWAGPATVLPPTSNISYVEASQVVQRREDDKRKRDAGKTDPKKQKKGAHEPQTLPGCQPGVDPDVSAFWMVMEVRCWVRLTACDCVAPSPCCLNSGNGRPLER